MTNTGYNVTKYKAIPNDGKPDTAAIQSTIDAHAKTSGAVVRIPAGTFLSEALVVRDNFTLCVI